MDRICWWYTDMLAQRGPGSAEPIPVAAPPRSAPPVKPQPVARPRRMTFKDRHALETLPERIAALQREVARLNALLADLDLYARDPARFGRDHQGVGYRRRTISSRSSASLSHCSSATASSRASHFPAHKSSVGSSRIIVASRAMCSVSIASHQQHDIRRAPEHSSLSISYLPTRCAFTHYMRRTAVALGILEAASTGSSAARECCYDLARKLTEPLSCDRPLRDRPAHDERLWTGITKANGALGNTSCLVGTAEQVA